MKVTYRSYYPMYVVSELAPHEYPVFAGIADKEGYVHQQLADHNNVLDGRGSGWNMDTADDRLIEPSTGLEWGAAAGDKPPLIRWKYGPGTSTIPRWEEKGTGGLNIVIADNQSMCLVNANNVSTMAQSLTFTPDDFDATIQAGRGNLQFRAAGNIQMVNAATETYYLQHGTTVASPTGTLLDATLNYVRVGFNAGASISSGQSVLFVGSGVELINDTGTGIKLNNSTHHLRISDMKFGGNPGYAITQDSLTDGSTSPTLRVTGGSNSAVGKTGSDVVVLGGDSAASQKGSYVAIQGGSAGTSGTAGDVIISSGSLPSGGAEGKIKFGKASDTDYFGELDAETGVATWAQTQSFNGARLQVTSGADGSKQGSPLAGEIYASSDKNVLRVAV